MEVFVQSSLALHTLAINAEGAVFGWGLNDAAQATGAATAGNSALVPARVGVPEEAVETAAGLRHSLIRSRSGRVFCFGEKGGGGERGVVEVPLPQHAVAVACGDRCSLVVCEGGAVFGWGSNNRDHQLGPGSGGVPVPTALSLPPPLAADPVIRVAMGAGHVLALTRGGSVWGWGRNAHGQLGHPGEGSPVPVPVGSGGGGTGAFGGPLRRASGVACGAEHSLVVTDLGRVFGFGSNRFGQLGIGNSGEASVATPTEVTFFSRHLVVAVACGAHHSVFVSDEGTLFAAGWNQDGQLGLEGGAEGADDAAALLIEDTEQRWLAIGRSRSAREKKYLPEPVAIWEPVVSAGCGREHGFAVGDSGSLWCWGFNGVGQLGDGTRVNRSVPVRIVAPPVTRVGGASMVGDPRSAIRRQCLFLQEQQRLLEQGVWGASSSGAAAPAAPAGGGGGSGGGRKGKLRHSAPPRRHCPGCGKSLKDGLHFCVHCGRPVDEAKAAPAAAAEVVAPPTAVDEPVPTETLPIVPPSTAPVPIITPPPAEPAVEAETTAGGSAPSQLEGRVPALPRTGEGKGAKLPKMSALQKAMFDMPSPMPVQKPVVTAEKKASLDHLSEARVVSKRLSEREKK